MVCLQFVTAAYQQQLVASMGLPVNGGGGRSSISAALIFVLVLLIVIVSSCRGFAETNGLSSASASNFPRRRRCSFAAAAPAPGHVLALASASSSAAYGGDNDDFHPFSSPPPYLAIVTEEGACDSDEDVDRTIHAVERAVADAATTTASSSEGMVDLVSIRVRGPAAVVGEERGGEGSGDDEVAAERRRVRQEHRGRVVRLARALVDLASNNAKAGVRSGSGSGEPRRPRSRRFRVVVSSDWLDAAVESGADGVHFKESHRHLIEDVRDEYSRCGMPCPPVVGTSAHSVESAVQAWNQHRPDYLFVGTAYPTATHPEKVEVEGPALPGQVVAAMLRSAICSAADDGAAAADAGGDGDPSNPANNSGGKRRRRPKVFAIGGIDADKCREPVVEYGADGVAVIRSVMQADDPAEAVRRIRRMMS